MITIQQIIDAWLAFFHSPSLPHSIAVFRILVGLLVVANGLLMIPVAKKFFGPNGLLPYEVFYQSERQYKLNLFLYLPKSNASLWILLAINIVAGACLVAGYFTYISALVAFITNLSFYIRNRYHAHSGDTVLRYFLFLLIFSRAGDCLSVDAFLAGHDVLFPTGLDKSPWVERLIQIQVGIIYLRTVVWKFHGEMWRSGTAAGYAMQLKDFQRFVPPKILLSQWVVKLATWGTLFAETALGTAIWVREFRYPTIAMGVIMHLGFELFLDLQLFGLIMITGLLLFVEPSTWVSVIASLTGIAAPYP
jgi:uncharacterized membrane protein YphA (DoxX/SURF4 family)